jgi:DNA topoisomerase-2
MSNTNIEERYKKLTHKEHILTRPETYIGSIHTDTRDIFLPINCDNFENLKMEYRNVSYSPGFLKIFDEIITNASDHAIRTGLVSHINVNITNDTISVENDGGIPVVMHSKEKMYVPELIFGNLLTGENYEDTEVRFVGGRNGYGAKLTNIYSKTFIVETADGKKEYFQKFSENMSKMNKPKIKKSKKNYTKITYIPDFEKFEMTEIDGDMLKILTKRVIDIAAYNPTVKVSLNGNLIPIRSFNDYMKLFLQEDDKVYYEKINEFLEIGITKSPTDMFAHVSMVNGISTTIGGSHVNHVTNTIVSNIKDIITKANKGINIRPNDIRNRFLVFINCKVPNPIFDNQTKENLTSKLDSTIRNITINEPMLKRISKSDILADLVELSMMKDKIQLEKEMNKSVTKRVKVEKLVDANKAGKVGDSQKCHLFLTEGDCLHEDTYITILRDSEKLNIKIKDVKLDDVVITHNSKFRLISNISKKIEKSVIINLKNDQQLICSENHRWFIYDKIQNDFYFIKTKDLNLQNHKMIINKNVNFNSLVKIENIVDIKDPKFHKVIYIKNDEILSTNKHNFSVYNIETNSIMMVVCDELNNNIHFLIDYDKI